MNDNEIIKALECYQESARVGKKYKYDRLENIERYDGWDLVEIVPAKSVNHYTMCVMCKDITPPINGELVRSVLYLIKRQKEVIAKMEEESTIFAKRFYKEGIKDFAERLKEKTKVGNLGDGFVYSWEIENLVKEMTEGEQRKEDEGK